MTAPIATNLILGFLGTGKTTAIRSLLAQKPAAETWAVLVNEFGEVGIDGALLADQGVHVREVPGGCMCCVSGLPMQIALNSLIQRSRPDRLLIEPTGLGHPRKILQTLSGEFYRNVLDLRASIGLVDPRQLANPRVLANENFQAQVAVADVLLANKIDLCPPEALAAFESWAGELRPAKQRVGQAEQGRLPMTWLDLPNNGALPPAALGHQHDHGQTPQSWLPLSQAPWQWRQNRGEGHFSLGWKVHPAIRFEPVALARMASDPRWLRFKGVVHTDDGWQAINAVAGEASFRAVAAAGESRLELISQSPLADPEALDQTLQAMADYSGENGSHYR